MDKRERVMRAIKHESVDQVPKGELAIEAELANKLLGGGYSLEFQDFEREKAVRELLGIDLINVGDWPSEQIGENEEGGKIFKSVYGEKYIFNGKSKHIMEPPFEDIEDVDKYVTPDINQCSGQLIKRFVEETDLFVFAQIGGPVSMLNEMMGMEDYLVYCMTNTEEIKMLAEKVMVFELQKAKLFIDQGAHGIFVADDIAFNTGLFLPPYIMEEVAYPFYKELVTEIKKYKDIPVFMHTDGMINDALAAIAMCGFDGLHSLQPSAGMDIAKIKEEYGEKLCLMGNIDLDYIMTFASEEEVEKDVKRVLDIATLNSGFILSTCNILIDAIPVENAKKMYQVAGQYKVN